MPVSGEGKLNGGRNIRQRRAAIARSAEHTAATKRAERLDFWTGGYLAIHHTLKPLEAALECGSVFVIFAPTPRQAR